MEIFYNCLKAFIVGGAICLVGQILIDFTKLTPARILVAYVTAGVILTAIGLYEPLVEFAGAGATVPLTGFGYTLAKGVQKGLEEYGLLGALTGGVTATSAGITAAIVFSYVVSLVSRSGSK
ncbi:MAG TPA: stage V sporulation protein AE [Clostridiales bacterium]|nr:stage V sporulation protein AE [Clostridiales bacterium]